MQYVILTHYIDIYRHRVNPHSKKEQDICPAPQFLFCVTLVELLDTSTSCDITLTAGEERMALGANINSQLSLGGAGSKSIAAAADNLCLEILWMNTVLHYLYTSLFPILGSITSPLCENLVRLSFPQWGKAEIINFADWKIRLVILYHSRHAGATDY